MEKTAQRLKNELQYLSDYKSTIMGDYAYIKEARRGSIDYNSIPSLRGIDLDLFRKEDITTWKLSRLE